MDTYTRIAPEFSALANKFNVNVQGLTEAIWQPKFDTLAYAAAGQTQLIFFRNPVGSAGVNEDDTNMNVAGTIAAPQQFLGGSSHRRRCRGSWLPVPARRG